jgi:hypothetical protein
MEGKGMDGMDGMDIHIWAQQYPLVVPEGLGLLEAVDG